MVDSIHKTAIMNDGASFSCVKKVYLSYPGQFFLDKPDLQFEIFNKISSHFNVPFSAIRLTGSAHTGYSFHKKKNFTTAESDLDVAIIDSGLFQKYLEISYEYSDGFSPEKFQTDKNGRSLRNQFVSYSGRGILRPDLMPPCPKKNDVHAFFNKLSIQHSSFFKSISAGFYISETMFLLKQRNSLKSIDMEAI